MFKVTATHLHWDPQVRIHAQHRRYKRNGQVINLSLKFRKLHIVRHERHFLEGKIIPFQQNINPSIKMIFCICNSWTKPSAQRKVVIIDFLLWLFLHCSPAIPLLQKGIQPWATSALQPQGPRHQLVDHCMGSCSTPQGPCIKVCHDVQRAVAQAAKRPTIQSRLPLGSRLNRQTAGYPAGEQQS